MSFIDHEDWLDPSSPPTLKAVFDNLRNYPLLAAYFSASALIHKSEKFGSVAIAYFLFTVFGVLFLLSLLQTLNLVTAVILNTFFPGHAKPKFVYLTLAAIFVLLFGYATFAAMLTVTNLLTEVATGR